MRSKTANHETLAKLCISLMNESYTENFRVSMGQTC
jgi:hypothetical protein